MVVFNFEILFLASKDRVFSSVSQVFLLMALCRLIQKLAVKHLTPLFRNFQPFDGRESSWLIHRLWRGSSLVFIFNFSHLEHILVFDIMIYLFIINAYEHWDLRYWLGSDDHWLLLLAGCHLKLVNTALLFIHVIILGLWESDALSMVHDGRNLHHFLLSKLLNFSILKRNLNYFLI